MRKYEIKLRIFLPPKVEEDWMQTPVSDWEWLTTDWGDEEFIETVYARQILEGDRTGLSIKLLANVVDEASDPSSWDWASITDTDSHRVDFIRAQLVEDSDVAECLQCEKPFPRKMAWKDVGGYTYCSESCLFSYNGEGAYRVAPSGTVFEGYQPEEE